MGYAPVGKFSAVVLCLLLVLSMFVLGGLNGYYFLVVDGDVDGNEVVWWNTTEFSTESYTAPFFEVYRLKYFGQAA
jgi:hypothetical protein